MLLSHNHGGLWALDASDPTDPVARAFFFPDKTDDGPVPSGFGTVFVQEGRIYAPEYRTGLYVLALADLPPGDAQGVVVYLDDADTALAKGPLGRS